MPASLVEERRKELYQNSLEGSKGLCGKRKKFSEPVDGQGLSSLGTQPLLDHSCSAVQNSEPVLHKARFDRTVYTKNPLAS